MYEDLLIEAENEHIEVIEKRFRSKGLKGLYSDGIIAINDSLTNKDKANVLAEELGHYHRTYGNILDQSIVNNRKEERKARIWAYKKLVGITQLIDAYELGIRNRYELSEYLNVTEDFIEEAINYYHELYGMYVKLDNYAVYFNQLAVMEMI